MIKKTKLNPTMKKEVKARPPGIFNYFNITLVKKKIND
jgi:hypothetical protein